MIDSYGPLGRPAFVLTEFTFPYMSQTSLISKAAAPINWKKNLVFIWLAQFLSICGFSFALPFVPFFIQELGVTDPKELAFWVTIFAALAPLTLAIFSPIWGALADRFGRRMMLIRANLGSMFFLFSMGLVPSVQWLIALRSLHGLLTGTMTASQTLASLYAPQNRSGLVLGALSAAVFSGSMTGAFLGGLFADLYGYRKAFFISACFLLLSTLLVTFAVRENFQRPPQSASRSWRHRQQTLIERLRPVAPILGLLVGIGMVVQFDSAWLPLLVQEIHGNLQGVAFMAGSLAAIGGIAGFIAGPAMGRLADRFNVPAIAKISAVGGALAMMGIALAGNFKLLLSFRFAATFFAGGLEPVFWVWLARVTSQKHRGFIFGWAATARSFGWMLAPLFSGFVVRCTGGVRGVFWTAALLYLVLIPCIVLTVKRLSRE